MSYTQDPTTLLQCVLFYDSNDGEELGRLVSLQLLRSFLDEFDNFDFMKSTGMVDVSRFATFGTKLHDSIRSAVGPVLENLVAQKGLLQAIIVYEDGKTHADSGVGQEISLFFVFCFLFFVFCFLFFCFFLFFVGRLILLDGLGDGLRGKLLTPLNFAGLAANIQHLITLSRSFGQEKGGKNFTYLETPDKVVLIYRLHLDGSLVCICKRMIGQKLASKSEYMVSCAAASALLDKGSWVEKGGSGERERERKWWHHLF